MYRIIIVDDEMFVRMGLKMSVNWEANGLELVGEASNGAEALELIEKVRPDIILTDIKMPEMDGVELVKRVRKDYPAIKCLVLSNYDDFELVKESLKNGASDYLLKVTIDSEKLVEVILNVCSEIEKDKQIEKDTINSKRLLNENKHIIKSRLILDLQKSGINDKEALDAFKRLGLKIAGESGYISIVNVNIEERIENTIDEFDFSYMRRNILTLLDEIVNDGLCGEAFLYKEGTYLVITECSKAFSCINERQQVKRIKAAMESYLNLYPVIVCNLHFDSFMGMVSVIKKLDQLISLGFYEFPGSIVEAEKIRFFNGDINEYYLKVKKDIEVYIKYYDIEKIRLSIENFIAYFQEKKAEPVAMKGFILFTLNFIVDGILANSKLQLKFDMLKYTDQIQKALNISDVKKACNGFIKDFYAVVRESHSGSLRNEVLKVVEYLEHNYAEKITLEKMAKYASMNKNYFCMLFKKETGMHFQNYLMDIRMKNAAKLIIGTNKAVNEVAYEVGYSDISYFNKTFKKCFGVAPSAYKNLNEIKK